MTKNKMLSQEYSVLIPIGVVSNDGFVPSKMLKIQVHYIAGAAWDLLSKPF